MRDKADRLSEGAATGNSAFCGAALRDLLWLASVAERASMMAAETSVQGIASPAPQRESRSDTLNILA